MVVDESALAELSEAFRAGDGLDVAREAARMVFYELIETEFSDVIGAARYERTEERSRTQWEPPEVVVDPRPATSTCESRSCGRAPTSRRCRSRAAVSTRRCGRW